MPQGNKNKRKHQNGSKSPAISPKRNNQKNVNFQQDPQQNNNKQFSTQQSAAAAISIRAVKPIISKCSLPRIREVCSKINFSKKPVFQVRDNKTIQIYCGILADKKLLIEALKADLVNFFTYSEPSERPFSLVLKGFYDINPAELLKILKEHQIPAIKCAVLFKSEHHTLFVINFAAGSTTLNSLMQVFSRNSQKHKRN